MEEFLKEKMAQGYNIFIECKGKSREFGMTYEGSARKVGEPFEYRHGIGETLKELLENMFGEGIC